ncbi:hypothetical protein O3M35_001079 [Rhynocoris fuscipes]|uniref:CHK kinase-like domain-containing protein n=1 Tax=Rhynocoris fuscipes TaxID=488301 RepID=A0AAW1DQH9_9HEMI
MTASYNAANSQDERGWLETLLHKYHHDEAVSSIVGLSKEDVGVKGDNYSSQISRVTLQLYLNSGRKSKKTLIVKSPINMEIPMPLFKTEIKVYGTILKELTALMRTHQDPHDTLWCEMIGHDEYKAIVFEDLKAGNFQIADRRKLLDLNHGLLVLNSLGRFHAMTHVLLCKGLLDKNDLGGHLFSPPTTLSKRLLEGGFQQLSCVMDEFWPPEWKETAKKFARESKLVEEKVLKIFEQFKDSFLVMNHGDCWTCNMMFKYCPYDETMPIAVKFFDFQISNVNSYIFDVTLFTYVCIRPDERRQNMDRLLKEYQKSLASTLEFYGMPGVAPTLEQVHADVKSIQYLAMFYSTAFLPASMADSSESFSMENILGTCEPKHAFNPAPLKSEKFRKLIEPDIRQWEKQGVL